jgi:hypothetical protein
VERDEPRNTHDTVAAETEQKVKAKPKDREGSRCSESYRLQMKAISVWSSVSLGSRGQIRG